MEASVKKEQEFARILTTTRKKARAQGNFLTEEELAQAFEGLKLSDEQFSQVRTFFTEHEIRIGTQKETTQSLPYETGVPTQEVQALFEGAARGEKVAKNRLIEIHMPMVEEIARLYEEQGVLSEDLVGEGYLALVTGVELIGASENVAEAQQALSGVVMNAMEDLIATTVADKNEDMKMLDKVQETADKAKALADEYHRDLTVEELMDETDLTKEDIFTVLRLVGGSLDGIDTGDPNGANSI